MKLANSINDPASKNRPVHRGRPRCEERRWAILKAASRLFLEKGFDGTSMDLVAKDAGVSKQTVYSHFSNKEMLFSSAITSRMEVYFPDNKFPLPDGLSLKDELAIVVRKIAELQFNYETISLFKLLVRESHKGPKLAEIFWREGPSVTLSLLRGVLKKWVNSGELVIDNLEEASVLVISMLRGVSYFEVMIGLVDEVPDTEIDKISDRCVENFLKIYGA